MGRFSEPLAPEFALVVRDVRGRVLDVGCGPGVLTDVLVRRYGAKRVDAIDPTPGFVEAARARLPGVDVRLGTAEELPYADGSYEVAFAQLVVHFMRDPVRGLSEMARVARGGLVAACVWDHGGGRGPVSTFWDCARQLDPEARRDADAAPGSHEGDLTRLFGDAGLSDVVEGTLSVTIRLASFEDWWAPYEEPVGSVGDYLGTRSADQVAELKELCRSRVPEGPFDVTAVAWTAIGRSLPSSR
jgi:SAM-dependent methyltransferase